MDLREFVVAPVAAAHEAPFQTLIAAHHYLDVLPRIGQTLWYVACWGKQWVALMCFSVPALKYGARDEWIGWDFRCQFDRLHLVTNNSRFLILPGCHQPNPGSRVLSLCQRRLRHDWPQPFGHPLLLISRHATAAYEFRYRAMAIFRICTIRQKNRQSIGDGAASNFSSPALRRDFTAGEQLVDRFQATQQAGRLVGNQHPITVLGDFGQFFHITLGDQVADDGPRLD